MGSETFAAKVVTDWLLASVSFQGVKLNSETGFSVEFVYDCICGKLTVYEEELAI